MHKSLKVLKVKVLLRLKLVNVRRIVSNLAELDSRLHRHAIFAVKVHLGYTASLLVTEIIYK